MKMSRAYMKVTAPAVVVLATVVNAAAGQPAMAQPQQSTPDLAWAVKGGATHSARNARVFFAEKAATAIHSLDRLSGVPAAQPALEIQPFAPYAGSAPLHGYAYSPVLQPAHSTHQHSAP